MLLCGSRAFAQSVSASIAPRTSNVLRSTLKIPVEGSYAYSTGPSLDDWSFVTNFNTLPATNFYDYPMTNAHRFFRLQRLAVPPQITQQPQGVTNYSGPSVTLQGAASGSWPLRLQWYKATAPLPTLIPGATNNTLVIPGASVNSGNYSLMASNLGGIALSASATVQIVPVVLTTIAGKKLHFEIQAISWPQDVSPGNSYDMECRADGNYYTTGTSVFLNDSGTWGYTYTPDASGRIGIVSQFVYGNAAFLLTFESRTNGTYRLGSGNTLYQIGTFSVPN
jgi:hypothetical protein